MMMMMMMMMTPKTIQRMGMRGNMRRDDQDIREDSSGWDDVRFPPTGQENPPLHSQMPK